MTRYVALLRGINVGGNNLIRMPALADCFRDHGFEDVTTYIQSGNVVFSAGRERRAELTARIQRMLSTTFDHYDASVVLRSARQMRSIVADAPAGFGDDPSRFRYDVVFLEAVPDGRGRASRGSDEGGRRFDGGGHRRPVLLPAREPSDPEPAPPRRVDADLPADDDPQLEHDHEARRAPGGSGEIDDRPIPRR